MTKYRLLRDHLCKQTSSRMEMTFHEIEQIIGTQLPPSAYAPRWWISGQNCQHTPLWQEMWRSAGYTAELVLGDNRVEFRRRA